MAAIRDAQTRGQKVFAETCPQYLLLGRRRSRPAGPRGRQMDVQPARARRGGSRGDLARRAERHLSDRLVRPRALSLRRDRQARQGAEPRLQADRERHPRHRAAPAAAVLRRRAARAGSTSNRFVELGCTNPAKIYGLHPKKGTIAIGSDADLALWDPERTVEVTDATTHDATGYCPYAGMTRDRLAGHRDLARRGDRGRRRASGRARPRPLPAARRRRGREARRACPCPRWTPRATSAPSCSIDCRRFDYECKFAGRKSGMDNGRIVSALIDDPAWSHQE